MFLFYDLIIYSSIYKKIKYYIIFILKIKIIIIFQLYMNIILSYYRINIYIIFFYIIEKISIIVVINRLHMLKSVPNYL
jgi:hypothetical protein